MAQSSNLSPSGTRFVVQSLAPYFAGAAFPVGANAALVFQRYLPLWKDGYVRVEPIKGPLEEFAKAFSGQREEERKTQRLAQTIGRQKRLFLAKGAAPTLRVTLKTTTRLLTGVGAPHPSEVGLLLHGTYGVPYLPGSTVKGWCRGIAEWNENATDDERNTIFGPETLGDDDPHWLGGVAFLDALPTTWPKLDIDIINCHNSAYYTGDGKNPPNDWQNPIPVYFLALSPGATFDVYFRATKLGDVAMIEKVWEWLNDGLSWHGVGAKGAAGYGFLDVVGEPERNYGKPTTAVPIVHKAEVTLEAQSKRAEQTFSARNIMTESMTNEWKPVTVFLSHSSADKAHVLQVAVELQKRGITPWLDRDNLMVGDDLDKELAKQIDNSAVVALFLSENSVDSDWVDTEIRRAISLEDRGKQAQLVPVFWGDPNDPNRRPEQWVRHHPELRQRWINAKTDTINRVYVHRESAADIADELAKRAFENAQTKNARDVGILIDIRGEGERKGPPDRTLLPSVGVGSTPTMPLLLFRPDAGVRSFRETMDTDSFKEFANHFKTYVSRALGSMRTTRDVYIGGDAPLAVSFWLVGQLFDRTTSATLYCHNSRFKTTLNDKNLRREITPLESPPDSGKHLFQRDQANNTWLPLPNPKTTTPPMGEGKKVALVVIAKSDSSTDEDPELAQTNYMDAPREDNKKWGGDLPLLWLPHPRIFTDSKQAQEWIRKATAAVGWLKSKGVEGIHLYTSLPNFVLPLWAAQLTAHVSPPITFMEWLEKPDDDGRVYTPIDNPYREN